MGSHNYQSAGTMALVHQFYMQMLYHQWKM